MYWKQLHSCNLFFLLNNSMIHMQKIYGFPVWNASIWYLIPYFTSAWLSLIYFRVSMMLDELNVIVRAWIFLINVVPLFISWCYTSRRLFDINESLHPWWSISCKTCNSSELGQFYVSYVIHCQYLTISNGTTISIIFYDNIVILCQNLTFVSGWVSLMAPM